MRLWPATTDYILVSSAINYGAHGTAAAEYRLSPTIVNSCIRGTTTTGDMLVPSAVDGGTSGTTAARNMLNPAVVNGGTRGTATTGDILLPTAVNGRVCCRVACRQVHGHACSATPQRLIVMGSRQYGL